MDGLAKTSLKEGQDRSVSLWRASDGSTGGQNGGKPINHCTEKTISYGPSGL